MKCNKKPDNIFQVSDGSPCRILTYIHPSKMLGCLLGVVSLLKKILFLHLVGNFCVYE